MKSIKPPYQIVDKDLPVWANRSKEVLSLCKIDNNFRKKVKSAKYARNRLQLLKEAKNWFSLKFGSLENKPNAPSIKPKFPVNFSPVKSATERK